MADSPVSLSPAIVTGGCGFTGSHMVRGLLEHEEKPEIHVLARSVRDEIPGVTYHQCDISSRDEVQASQFITELKAIMSASRQELEWQGVKSCPRVLV